MPQENYEKTTHNTHDHDESEVCSHASCDSLQRLLATRAVHWQSQLATVSAVWLLEAEQPCTCCPQSHETSTKRL